MDNEGVRDWPALPKECLENVVRRGGPQAAACLSSTCNSWRNDLRDDLLWRSWHGLPPLRHYSLQASYGRYAAAARAWLAGRETGAAAVAAAHERWLTSLDLSPAHVLSGSLDANVKFWDRSRPGMWLHYLRGHTGPVSSVRLAYDGTDSATSTSSYDRAYSGSRDGTLRCWDLCTGACVHAYTLEGGRQWVNTVAVWRPQQQYLPRGPEAGQQQQQGAGAGTRTVGGGGRAHEQPQRLHPTTSSHFVTIGGATQERHTGSASPQAPPSAPTASAAAGPGPSPWPGLGPMVVVCGTSIGQLCFYDVRQSGPAQRLVDLQQRRTGPLQGAVYGVSVYGDALAAACASGCIQVWDLRAGAVRHRLDEHGSACTCVAMYGDTLVAGDLEGSVYLWSTADGEGKGGGEIRFWGAISAAAAAATARRPLTDAPATAATARGPAAASAAASSPGGGGDGVATQGACGAAVHVPPGPQWPSWLPHRGRRTSLYDKSDGSSSDDGDNEELGRRRCKGAAAVALLEALADGRAMTMPYNRRQLPPTGSPWLRSPPPCDSPSSLSDGTAGGASGAVAETPAAAVPGVDRAPRLHAVMRQREWVRDVALVGPSLALSCSKDGRVVLSRTDMRQVVAVWDVAAAGSGVGRPDDGPTPGFSGASGSVNECPGGSRVACGDTVGASGGGSGGSPVANQVHALAADEWGFVAGCQDASMRVWWFAPAGALPELWAPCCESTGSRGLQLLRI